MAAFVKATKPGDRSCLYEPHFSHNHQGLVKRVHDLRIRVWQGELFLAERALNNAPQPKPKESSSRARKLMRGLSFKRSKSSLELHDLNALQEKVKQWRDLLPQAYKSCECNDLATIRQELTEAEAELDKTLDQVVPCGLKNYPAQTQLFRDIWRLRNFKEREDFGETKIHTRYQEQTPLAVAYRNELQESLPKELSKWPHVLEVSNDHAKLAQHPLNAKAPKTLTYRESLFPEGTLFYHREVQGQSDLDFGELSLSYALEFRCASLNICDALCNFRYDNGWSCQIVADGCAWYSEKAAVTSIVASEDILQSKLEKEAPTNTSEAAEILSTCIKEIPAHLEKADIDKGTTLSIALTCPEDGGARVTQASIGDISVFVYNPKNGSILNVTEDNDVQFEDPTTCGGRLERDTEDFGNLSFRTFFVPSGCYLISCSDGIADNIKPEMIHIKGSTEAILSTVLQGSQTPEEVGRKMIEHSLKISSAIHKHVREKRRPVNSPDMPGKEDHISVAVSLIK